MKRIFSFILIVALCCMILVSCGNTINQSHQLKSDDEEILYEDILYEDVITENIITWDSFED